MRPTSKLKRACLLRAGSKSPATHSSRKTSHSKTSRSQLSIQSPGAPAIGHHYGPTARCPCGNLAKSNYLYVGIGDARLFYWPTLSTDLEKPTYYVDNVRLRHDNIFGYQALFKLDAFQVFGIDRPKGVKWDLDLDYLSERGFGYGTGIEYGTDHFFSIAGPTDRQGFDAWFISSDHGFDNLGQDRRHIDPEEDFRGKVVWDQRQHIAGGLLDNWTLQTEVGWLSDRTFLEEYYEDEWDNNKDLTTGVRLKRTFDNQSLSLEANAQINDFFTQTQWLPRLDHYWLGQPLLGDNLTWFEHCVGRLCQHRRCDESYDTDPAVPPGFEYERSANASACPGKTTPTATRSLATVSDSLRARKSIGRSMRLPSRSSPTALANSATGAKTSTASDSNARWVRPVSAPAFRSGMPTRISTTKSSTSTASRTKSSSTSRRLSPAQTRTSLACPFTTNSTTIRSKTSAVVCSSNPSAARSPERITFLVLVPVCRRPSIRNSIRGFYAHALRSGKTSVTSPSDEIADDLIAIRTGMHHRLQTKRGAPGEEHIVDWVTFDANATIFPKAERDDAGASVGMLDYDFRWNIGDRTSVLSDGYADTFGDGLRTASIGVLLNRPARGNFYLGFRAADGLFVADVISATINYRMSDKWIGSSTSSIDFGPTHYTGETFGFTRVGESLLTTLGASVDASKSTVGIHFLVEPRFLPKLQTTTKTGIELRAARRWLTAWNSRLRAVR